MHKDSRGDYRRDWRIPNTLLCWSSPQPRKTAIRFVCQIEDNDTKLEPALDSWKRLEVPARIVRAFNPHGQAKWWYHYLGSIAPTSFKVELRAKDGYIPLTEPDKLIAEINAEREHFEFFVPPDMPWAMAVRTKNDEERSSWIFEEVFPGERFK